MNSWFKTTAQLLKININDAEMSPNNKLINSKTTLDSSLIESIKELILEEKPRESLVVHNNKRPKRSKRIKDCKTKQLFGNPMRNISDELVEFYKSNLKHKRVILPILQNLGFDSKNKKFAKWPILLKDFIQNLHDHLVKDVESDQKQMDIKLEVKEEELGSTKVTKKSRGKLRRSLKFESAKEEVQTMERRHHNISLKTGPTDQKSHIRNLHSELPQNLLVKEESKSEELKNEEIGQEDGEQTPNEYTIDMNWNEVLSELESSDSKTVRTIRSQSNDQKDMITGEKIGKASRIERFKIDSHHSHKSNQLDYKEENWVGNYSITRRGIIHHHRKDYSSLKRNLFSEFNSLINDDHVKKDTEDEIFNSSQAGQELKHPSIKQDIQPGELDWMSPIKIETIKYNQCIDTPSINRELCGKKRLRYESCYSSGWENSTPRMYEQWEEQKDQIYYHDHPSPINHYEQYAKQEEEDDDIEESDGNPGIRTARSERGLKRLSVKVRDLVFKLKETSYKDVANKLIEELVTDGEYDEYGRKLDKKSSHDKKTKEEKNVRRRVYDALNVLIASGVLKKNANKNVLYEEKPENRMKGLKLVIKKKNEYKKRDLLKSINFKRFNNQNKKDKLKDSLEKLIAFKKLIERNKALNECEKIQDVIMNNEIYDKIHEDKLWNTSDKNELVKKEGWGKIHFPLIVVGTENKKDNQVNFWYSNDKSALVLSFKKQFSLMGDMDILLKLGFQENEDKLQYTQDPYKIQNLIDYSW